MANGIVMVDQDTIGYFVVVPDKLNNKIILELDSAKDVENFLELTAEHGATMQFLITPDEV